MYLFPLFTPPRFIKKPLGVLVVGAAAAIGGCDHPGETLPPVPAERADATIGEDPRVQERMKELQSHFDVVLQGPQDNADTLIESPLDSNQKQEGKQKEEPSITKQLDDARLALWRAEMDFQRLENLPAVKIARVRANLVSEKLNFLQHALRPDDSVAVRAGQFKIRKLREEFQSVLNELNSLEQRTHLPEDCVKLEDALRKSSLRFMIAMQLHGAENGFQASAKSPSVTLEQDGKAFRVSYLISCDGGDSKEPHLIEVSFRLTDERGVEDLTVRGSKQIGIPEIDEKVSIVLMNEVKNLFEPMRDIDFQRESIALFIETKGVVDNFLG